MAGSDKPSELTDAAQQSETQQPLLNPSEEERFWPTMGLIIFFSVLGVLSRIGLVILNTFPNEPVFPLVWAQIIGCFFYGVFQHRKAEITAISLPLYVGLTTGFCGTVTTFSAFMETTFRNLVGSPTYSILGTHVVFVNLVAATSVVIITFGMAAVSISFGATVSSAFPANSKLLSKVQYGVPQRSLYSIKSLSSLDFAFVFLGVASLVASIIVLALSRNYMYFFGVNLAFSCVLAPLGSVIRWQLAKLNKKWKSFPTGTFIVNISGTVIRGICSMLLIRLDAGHMAPILLSFITGVKDGFCGGLTTLSTMANEMLNLSFLNSLTYTLSSVVLSQLLLGGAIFPFAIPPAVTPFMVAMPPINLCPAFKNSCDYFLYRIGCPYSQWTSVSCTDSNDYNTMNGTCICGTLDMSTRIQEQIFDMQLKPYLPGFLNTTVMQGVFANWPIYGAPKKGVDPTPPESLAKPFGNRRRDTRNSTASNSTESSPEPPARNASFYLPDLASFPHVAIDICSSFDSVCDFLMDQFMCPTALRTTIGCTTPGDVSTFNGTCTCGFGGFDGSTRVQELIIDSQIKGDIPFTKIHQPPLTINGNWSLSICPSFSRTCDSLMVRLACPDDQIQNVACNGTSMTQDTFVGECACGGLDASTRVLENINDNDVNPQVKDFIWESTKYTFWKTVDFCPTYTSICSEMHARFGCPLDLQINNGCTGSTPATFKGDCMCGGIDLGERMTELVTDFIVLPMLPSIASPGTIFINT